MRKKAKLYPYMNRFTGDIQIVTKRQAKDLSEDYSAPQIVKNEQGVDVMRFQIESGGVIATVDLQENEEQVEVIPDGKRSTK